MRLRLFVQSTETAFVECPLMSWCEQGPRVHIHFPAIYLSFSIIFESIDGRIYLSNKGSE